MKNKILTTVSAIMLFIPWTILPLRTYDWALESPVAEIMISCYAAFMIFSGVFTIISYVKEKAQNNLMKVCLIVNGIYAVGGCCFLYDGFTQSYITRRTVMKRIKITVLYAICWGSVASSQKTCLIKLHIF